MLVDHWELLLRHLGVYLLLACLDSLCMLRSSPHLLLCSAGLANVFFLQLLVFSLLSHSIVRVSVILAMLLSVSQSYRHV